jgi:hypothetical protein
MELRRVVGYLANNVRRYGVGATLHDLQCRLINKVAQLQILRGMTLRTRDVRDPSLFEAPGFDSRFLSESELLVYAQDPAHQMTSEFLRIAIARGDLCYALIDCNGGALAAYGWYTRLHTPLDKHFVLHFDPTWTYMYNGYTMPKYRGKRLHAVGMCRALREMGKEGTGGLISCVASNNFASLQSVLRLGYRIFGDLYLLRAVGHSYIFATRGCRRYGFRAEPLAPTHDLAATMGFSKQ